MIARISSQTVAGLSYAFAILAGKLDAPCLGQAITDTTHPQYDEAGAPYGPPILSTGEYADCPHTMNQDTGFFKIATPPNDGGPEAWIEAGWVHLALVVKKRESIIRALAAIVAREGTGNAYGGRSRASVAITTESSGRNIFGDLTPAEALAWMLTKDAADEEAHDKHDEALEAYDAACRVEG